MDSTLTIRLPKESREALRKRASSLNVAESKLVRDLIEREISDLNFAERCGDLIGSLDSRKEKLEDDAWRKKIRARNWRK